MMRPQVLKEVVTVNPELALTTNQRRHEQATEESSPRHADGTAPHQPVASRMARKLPGRGSKVLSRTDRLEGHLNQADDLD
jgi:hypothetical protein